MPETKILILLAAGLGLASVILTWLDHYLNQREHD